MTRRLSTRWLLRVQPLLLLTLVVELRQGQRTRRCINGPTPRAASIGRVIVGVVAACGIIYVGYVEFLCIALTGAADADVSAEMDWATYSASTTPVAALLLLTGWALIAELLGGSQAGRS